MRNFLRKLAGILAGGAQPRHAALGVFLGLLAGFVAGWNFTLLIVVLLAVLFNVSAVRFCVTFAAGLLAAWLGEPMLAAVGYLVLERMMVGSALAATANSPVAAMFDLDRFALMGGLAAGGPLAFALARLTSRRLAARQSGANRNAASHAAWLRPMGIPAVAVGLALAAWLPWRLGALAVEDRLLAEFSRMHGARVTAENIDLSLWSGRLTIENLEIPDPNDLDRNRIQASRVTAQLKPAALLRGRLMVEDMQVEGLRADVRRSVRGTPMPDPAPKPATSAAGLAVESVEGLRLASCLRHWDTLQLQLAWLGRIVNAAETLAAWERPDDEGEPTVGLLEFMGMPAHMLRSDLGDRQPRLYIRQLRATGLDEGWRLGRDSELVATHLSSFPQLSRSAARIEVSAPEYEAHVVIEMQGPEEDPGVGPYVRLHASNVPLVDLVDAGRDNQPVWIHAGTATIDAAGPADGAGMQFAINIEANDLRAKIEGNQTVLGLEPELWNEGLETLGGFQADSVLAGTWESPCLIVNEDRLVDNFKHQLRGAGADRLAQAVERHTVERHTNLLVGGTKVEGDKDELLADDDAGFAFAADTVEEVAPVPARAAIRYPRTGTPQDEPYLPTLPSKSPLAIDSTADNDQEAYRAVDESRLAQDRRDADRPEDVETADAGPVEDAEPENSIAAEYEEEPLDDEADQPPEQPLPPRANRIRGIPIAADDSLPGPINLVIGYDEGSSASLADQYSRAGGVIKKPGVAGQRTIAPAPTRSVGGDRASAPIPSFQAIQGREYDLPDDEAYETPSNPADRRQAANNGAPRDEAGQANRTIRPVQPTQGGQGLAGSANQRNLPIRPDQATARPSRQQRPLSGQDYNQAQPASPGAANGLSQNREIPANGRPPGPSLESEPLEDEAQQGNAFSRWTRSMGGKIGGIFKKKRPAADDLPLEDRTANGGDPFRQMRR